MTELQTVSLTSRRPRERSARRRSRRSKLRYRAFRNQTGEVDYTYQFGDLGSSTLVAAAAYTYDHDSELTDIRYTDGAGNTVAGYHYVYNAPGIVGDEYSRSDTSGTIGSSDTSWAETSNTYDADGQLTAAAYSSNFASAPADFSAAYDPNGNRTSTGSTSETSSTDRLLFDGTYYYQYDAAGNRTARYENSVDQGR